MGRWLSPEWTHKLSSRILTGTTPPVDGFGISQTSNLLMSLSQPEDGKDFGSAHCLCLAHRHTAACSVTTEPCIRCYSWIIATKRHSKGSPRGGRFASGSRPDEQNVGTTLILQADAPDEGRSFYDWLAYEASIGPEVERLAIQRTKARDASHNAGKAYADALEAPTDKLQGDEHQRLNQQTVNTSDQFREAANDLFETLHMCLSEGGNKERYARLALHKQGLKVRRVALTRFTSCPRGAISEASSHYGADRWTRWSSGDGKSGLQLLLYLAGQTAGRA